MTLYHLKTCTHTHTLSPKQDYTHVDHNQLDDPLPFKSMHTHTHTHTHTLSLSLSLKQDYTHVDHNQLDDPLPFKIMLTHSLSLSLSKTDLDLGSLLMQLLDLFNNNTHNYIYYYKDTSHYLYCFDPLLKITDGNPPPPPPLSENQAHFSVKTNS